MWHTDKTPRDRLDGARDRVFLTKDVDQITSHNRSGSRSCDNIVPHYNHASYVTSESHSRLKRKFGTLGPMGVQGGTHENANAATSSFASHELGNQFIGIACCEVLTNRVGVRVEDFSLIVGHL